MVNLHVLDAELYSDTLTLTLEQLEFSNASNAITDDIVGHVIFQRLDALPVALPLRTKSLHFLGDGRFRAKFSILSEWRPLRAITFEALGMGSHWTFKDTLDRRLARLFPVDGSDYIDLLESHTRRWGNERTIYFLAEQVVRFFDGPPEHRVGASLIMAYKAVEIGQPECLNAARRINDEASAWLQELSLDWHPRRNREHLTVSVLTARWHLQIAMQNVPAARKTFCDILSLLAEPQSNYATLAYSASKSLLLGGWLEWRNGEHAMARQFWENTIAVFKLAVRDADPYRAVLFRELDHSLRAASLAGLCLRNLEKPRMDMPNLDEIINNSMRVPGRVRRRLHLILKLNTATDNILEK